MKNFIRNHQFFLDSSYQAVLNARIPQTTSTIIEAQERIVQ